MLRKAQQKRNLHFRWPLVSLIAVVAAFATALMTAPAAELTTAETSVVNDTSFAVSVEQGGSASFNVYVGASGAIKCVATSGNPATATVHTSYSVSNAGVISSTTPSTSLSFFASASDPQGSSCATSGLPCPKNNCKVTWSGAPTPFNVAATVGASASTPLGYYPSGCHTNASLGYSLPTAITNPAGSGGSLTDSTRGKVCIRVVEPAPPADSEPPLVDVSFPSPPAGQSGWFNANDVPVVGIVTATDPSNVASLSCTDGGSPLTLDGVTGLGTMNASATTSVSGDGTHSIECTATDGASPANSGAAAGSSNTASVLIDATAPTITASITPASPAASGWYNAATGAPTVSFTCFDGTSGLAAACPSDVTLGDGADQAVSGSITDNAGNSNSAGISDIDVDTTPPTITASIAPPSPAASGWYNAATGAPTVSFTCFDGTSGLAQPCPSDVTLSDGADQAVSGSVSDNAGNSNSATISDIDVDTTAPTITASITPASPAASGWYNAATSAPTVSFSCFDGTSGLAQPCPSDVTLGDGADQSVSGSVTDNAGNSNSDAISNIDVDTTPPTITASITPASPAASGWYNASTGAPTVSFTCFDNTSGLAAACPSDVTLGDGANQSVSGSVMDNAGNSNSDGISNIDVDTTLPDVSVTGYANGQVFNTGAPGTPPSPGCSAPSDATSGVAGSGGPTLIGGGLNANGVGFASYECTALDNAGNSGSDTKTFFVYYGGASGILQPINSDNSSVFHRGKAVPVKFRLAGDEFFGYSTAGWLVQRIQVSCENLSDVLLTEEVGSVTPSTTFRYDPSADQYIYNADFRDKAVGSCWRVKVSLDDGFTTMSSAYFKIAK